MYCMLVSVPIWGLFNLTKWRIAVFGVTSTMGFRPHLGII